MGVLLDIVLMAFLAGASATDIRARRVPNALVVAMAGCWALLAALAVAFGGMDAPEVVVRVVCALLLGGALLGLTCVFERFSARFAMGGGDIKLIACITLYLGLEGSCLCLLVACAVAVVLQRPLAGLGIRGEAVVAERSAGALPFVPALAIGALIAIILP